MPLDASTRFYNSHRSFHTLCEASGDSYSKDLDTIFREGVWRDVLSLYNWASISEPEHSIQVLLICYVFRTVPCIRFSGSIISHGVNATFCLVN